MTRSGLGKGLSSLIPKRPVTKDPVVDDVAKTTSEAVLPPIDNGAVRQVSVKDIEANPWQPRHKIDHVSLDDLINSIRQHGILQPLIVSPYKDRYQLIAGERRLEASKIIGFKQVPVIVRRPSDQQKLELSLVENIQRKNLNPIEKARGYKRLMDDFNLTQEEVSKKVGKSRVAVAQSLRLLALPEKIQDSLAEEKITEGHGKVLLSVTQPKHQLKLWQQMVSQQLTVRDSEAYREKSIPKTARRPIEAEVVSLEERLQEWLATRVRIQQRGRKGTIVIEYFSKEERNAIINKITKNQ
ncbi:MAG: ParB/RepB/Spo0J family partition protein [Patescibacteria group bacterium]